MRTIAPLTMLVLLLGACSDGTVTQRVDARADQSISEAGSGDVSQPTEASADRSPADITKTEQAVSPDQSSGCAPKVVPGCSGGFCTIPAGCFTMGSLPSDPCALVSPTPFNEQQHEVMITRGFKISETEVTQGDFKAQLGYNPSHNVSCGDSCPVENVTWSQAAEYCNALSSKAGLTPCYTCTGHGTTASCEEASGYLGIAVYQCPGYRLPTEAEWEYAYHAGTKTPLYNGTITNCGIGATDPTAAVDPNAELIAWYLGNANSKTHAVKQKQANGWGLYDMAGNVREWCHDWYTENLPATTETDPISAGVGERRNLRGGYYNQTARTLRGAFRYHFDPAVTDLTIGFRCVVKL